MKTIAGQRKTRFRGIERVGWSFAFAAAAYTASLGQREGVAHTSTAAEATGALVPTGETRHIGRKLAFGASDPPMLSMDDLFKGRHFDRESIIVCVRWYLRFKLSFRDLVEMMAERGMSLAHTTIMRWIQRAMFRNSKSAGTASPAGPAPRGASTRPM
jgi:hypothetical protein